MGTAIRAGEISRLYKQLIYQVYSVNDEGIRQSYKELLRSEEPLGQIMGVAMSSVDHLENRRRSGEDKSATNEFPKVQRVPVKGRSTSETSLQRALGVDVYIDRLGFAPVVANKLRGVDGDDRPPNALPTLIREQTEPTQVASEAESHEPVATDGLGNLDTNCEPFNRVSDITDDPRPISPAGIAQFPSSSLGRRLIVRLSRPAPATRAMIVLTAAFVVTAGIGLPLRAYLPADGNRPAAPHLAVISPSAIATAVGAAGFVGTAASATPVAVSPVPTVNTRPTVITPSAESTAKAAAIAAATPTIIPSPGLTAAAVASYTLKPGPDGAAPTVSSPEKVPTKARVSPSEVVALLQRGDALLATGDVANARLFYESAAIAGESMAALRLGESYDSLFLARAGLTGVRGDYAVAVRWYRRASELGARDAEILLQRTVNE